MFDYQCTFDPINQSVLILEADRVVDRFALRKPEDVDRLCEMGPVYACLALLKPVIDALLSHPNVAPLLNAVEPVVAAPVVASTQRLGTFVPLYPAWGQTSDLDLGMRPVRRKKRQSRYRKTRASRVARRAARNRR